MLQAIEPQNTDEEENHLDGDGDCDGENPLIMVMVMMHMLMLPPTLMLMTRFSIVIMSTYLIDEACLTGNQCPISAIAPRSNARARDTCGRGREIGWEAHPCSEII